MTYRRFDGEDLAANCLSSRRRDNSTPPVPTFQFRKLSFGYNGRLRRTGSYPKENNMSLNRISRRDALFVIGSAVCRANGGLLQATRVDHVSLAVGDIDKSVMFY